MSIQDENGQAHVGRVLDDALKAFNSALSCMADSNKDPHFCSNPAEYNWKYLGRREMLIPYNCDSTSFRIWHEISEPEYPNPNHIRWDKRNVWIVQGDLQPGESNLLSRRLFYIDKDSWAILLGEGFDASGCAVKCYMLSKNALSGTSRHGRWYRIGRRGATPDDIGSRI
jgi:hypothetical protein